MPIRDTVLDTVKDHDTYPPEAPFTAWPDPGRGYMVLDMRAMTWAAGPFRTPLEALETADHLNQGAVVGAHAKGSAAVKAGQK